MKGFTVKSDEIDVIAGADIIAVEETAEALKKRNRRCERRRRILSEFSNDGLLFIEASSIIIIRIVVDIVDVEIWNALSAKDGGW